MPLTYGELVHTAPIIPAEPRRDFRKRRTPLRARLLGWGKKFGVIAAAIAVPALAAPTTFGALQAEPAQPTVEPMPFETPGYSFPGSAFYYLEQSPRQLAFADADTLSRPGPVAFDASAPSALTAPALRIIGSDRDHARAQQCLTQAIYYEAASESESGQRAVAQVVLNRVAHSAYPRSVCGVVYQGSERSTGCQFTFTCDGSLARQPSQTGWNRASRIAREALAGVTYDRVGTATHYHTLAVNPYWAGSLQSVGVIGAHIFYRWPGAAGEPGAFGARYAGNEPAAGRARGTTQAAPDPASSPIIAHTHADAAIAADTAGLATIEADPAQSGSLADIAPASGSVRPEYANSGRWIERP